MRRIAGAACSVLLVVGAAACGGDDDDAATTTTTTEAQSTTTEAEDAPEEVTDEEVEGFEERAITFGNLTYTVVAAHVTNQDLRTYAEGSEAEVGDATHLILDVEVENATGRQIESAAAAINLVIGDDSSGVADDFLTDATGFIAANETVDGFFAFEIDEDAAAEDAELVFGIAPDREARLPLTGEVPDSEFPVEFPVSGTANGVGPTNGGTISFELLDATLFEDLPHGDTTSPTGERADDDEIFVQIHVRATKTDGRGNDVLGVDAFRLVVDGTPRSPFDVAIAPEGSTPGPTAEPGAAVDAWVLFAIESDGTEYVLEAGDLEQSPASLPIELPAI